MDKGERIAYAIKKSEHSPASMARELGCSAAAIYQWIDGTTKDLKNELLFALADKTGFSARWLATGEGPEIDAYNQPQIMRVLKVMEKLPATDQERVANVVDAFSQPAGNDCPDGKHCGEQPVAG